ncbi:DEAD/DEAH box helicase family protein [Streptomyces sp. SID8381]|uniref:DEAD/DEAH box helicase family protein n=2 Tax=unclassified Streptomyces TaxID=2593676 RepID=UPI00039D2B4F|nr:MULTISPECIES: DEAD/DEAH box helicase family protein [unclassified Streptomyces]MYX26764.1 DEAD/DEAH box helicase family protein [Streptomyces sp. SID8381]
MPNRITNAFASLFETKRARRPWREELHPRDSKGRFVETGGIARIWGGGFARVVRALSQTKVQISDLDGNNQRPIQTSRLTMVARPDGTAPTRSKEKVQAEEDRRDADPRRGDGVTSDDHGDPDSSDAPHDTDDEGEPIGDDEEPKKAPRFPTVAAARNHLESGAKDPRWKRPPRTHNGVHVRDASKQERAQVRIDTYSATRGMDFARTSQLSSNGNFLVTRHGNGKWDVYHVASGTIMTHQAGFRSKPDALHFANELENARDDRGRPFDWDAPYVADRLDMANGRDGIDAAIARGREHDSGREREEHQEQAKPQPQAEQPMLGDDAQDDQSDQDDALVEPAGNSQAQQDTAQQDGDGGRLATVAQVLDHWRTNPDVPRLRETHNERKQRESVARQRADLVTDPQVVDGFLIGKMDVKGKQRWVVFHAGTSVPIAILPSDKGKPDAIARAHAYRDYRDENGQPFNWDSHGIGARLDSPAGKRMREITSGRVSSEPSRHDTDVPDDATELAGFPGYRMARGEDGTNVFGPDGKRIATGRSVFDRNTRRSAYVGDMGDRHVSGRTETDFAVNAARQHMLASQPDDQKDPVWIQYSPSRALIHGVDRDDPDMHKRLRRAGFVWSHGAKAYVTTANTRPVTRALAVDNLVRGFAADGRQIEVRRDEDRLRAPATPEVPAVPEAPVGAPSDAPDTETAGGSTPDLASLDDAELQDAYVAATRDFRNAGFADRDRMTAAQGRAQAALKEMKRRDRLKYGETNDRRARVEPFDGKRSRYPVTIDGDDSSDASLQGSDGAWTWNRIGHGTRYSSEKKFRTRDAALADLIAEHDREAAQRDQHDAPETSTPADHDGHTEQQSAGDSASTSTDRDRDDDSADAADAPYGQDGTKTYAQAKTEIEALRDEWNGANLAHDLANGPQQELAANLGTSFRRLAATTGIRQRIQASHELQRSAEAVLASLDDEPGRDPYGKARPVLEAIRDRAARHGQRLDATLKDRRDSKNKRERPAEPAAAPATTGTDNQSAPDTTTPTGDDSSGSEQARADRREALADVQADGVRGAGDGGGEGGVLREARDGGERGDQDSGGADTEQADEREVHGPGGGQDAGDGAGPGDRDARQDLPAGRARDGERRASGSRQAVAAQSFRPKSQKDLAPSGEKARARANVAAVKTLRQIQAENRPATPAEQKVLARWSGWGALPIVLADKPEPTDGAFRDDDGNPDPAKYARALKRWESFAEERAAVRQLLSDDEWNAAKANTLNAHYTDAELVQPLWDLVQELGFDGGNVLEPGSGSGNFIGAAPEGARITGIELDPTTAAISQLLYPDARIINDSFGDVRMPNSFFDLAIGNVPFGRFPMYDEQVNPDNRHSIHDTFILKSLKKVRPGGLVAVITSRYTMDGEDDTARRQMSYMADLVGAVRLPAGAHQEAAGTGVVTDVLVFRRRFSDENTHDIDMSWTRSSKTTVNGHEIAVNDYFQQHPEMILGQLTTGRGQFSDHELTVVGDSNAGPALKAGLERIRQATYLPQERPNRMRYVPEIDAVDRNLELAGEKHEGAVHVLSDGSFTQVEDGVVIPLDVHPTQREQLRKLIALRDLTNRLLQLEGATRETGETNDMRALRRQLNEAYDAYVKQHGPIDKPGQTRYFSPQEAKDRAKAEGLKDVPDAWKLPSALQLFEDDPASAVVFGLDKWDDTAKSAKKADIFRQRVLAPREIADRADSPEQAIALAQELDGGELHLPTIARLLGRTDLQALREELGPLAFDEPGTNRLISRGEYLSGNVREKLAIAEAAAKVDPRFSANVAALKAVIPRDLDPSEIKVKMGAPWIPETDVTAFLQHLLGTKSVRAERGGASMWEVEGPSTGIAATSDWGTKKKPAPEIAKALLEQRTIVVTRTKEVGGKKVTFTDDEATSEAQAKAKEMAERFSEWVWEDPARAKRLARVYNDTFNNLVMREYDDSPLALPGANAEWKMRPHQNAAIRRIVSEKSVLLAHVVGAGKTATMVAGTQELRRTGMARKPAIVVPNHMLGQFRREYLELYPDAKLLTASSTDLTGKKRRRFVAKAATGDWDAIILTQGAFERIPMRAEAQEKYMRRELDKLEEAIVNAKARQGKSLTLKRLEETLKSKEAKLKQKLAAKKDQGAVHFEDTGIDYLMVDEAHGYKNLPTASHIEGASITGSARASDLHMKIEYLRDRNESGRVVTLATGTPIANSVTEAYVMQRFLRPDILEEAGVDDFDSWAATFGEIVQNLELAPDGSGFRMKARFARFHNAAELLRMYRLAVDVQTAADLNLPTPKVRAGADGRRGEVVKVPISAEQKAFVTALPNQEWVHKQGGVLKAIGLASRAAIDMRLVGGHGEEGGKIDAAVNKIAEIYEENKDRIYPVSEKDHTPQKLPGSLQIVFMDAGTPGSTAKNAWDAYAYMREQLAEAGVPANKIRFIHEAKTDKAKAKLFEDARTGKVAVLIGSTEKMGTGANIQTRAVALHHMDFPWRPADMAQREGRIERQGNLNMPGIPGTADDVRIISYVTEETFDAFKLGTLERKASFIAQMDRKDFDAREMEDIGDIAVSFGQMKAIATGDMTVMDYAQAGADVVDLQRADRRWHRDQDTRRRTVAAADSIIHDLATVLPAWRDALARREDVAGDKFRIRLGDQEFDQRADVYDDLVQRVRAAARNMSLQDGARVPLGHLGGHDFHVEIDHDQFGNRVAKVRFDWPNWEHPNEPDTRGVYTPSQLDEASGRGILASLERRLSNLDEAIADAEHTLEVAQDERARALRGLGGTSPYSERLRSKERRVALLSNLITANEKLKNYKGREVDPNDEGYLKAKRRVAELKEELGIEDQREREIDEAAAAAALNNVNNDVVTLDREDVERELAELRPAGASRVPGARSGGAPARERGESGSAGGAGTVTIDRDQVDEDMESIRPAGGAGSGGPSEPPSGRGLSEQGDDDEVPEPPVGADSPRAMSPEDLQAEIVALIEHEMVHGPLTGAAKTRLTALEAEKDRRAGKRSEREQPKPTPQRSGPGGNWADLTRDQVEGDGGEDDGLFSAPADPAGPSTAADPDNPLDRPDDEYGTPDMFADAEGRDTRDLRQAEIRRADQLKQGDRFTDADGRVHTVAEPPNRTGRGRVRIVTQEGRELFYRPSDEVRLGGADAAPRDDAASRHTPEGQDAPSAEPTTRQDDDADPRTGHYDEPGLQSPREASEERRSLISAWNNSSLRARLLAQPEDSDGRRLAADLDAVAGHRDTNDQMYSTQQRGWKRVIKSIDALLSYLDTHPEHAGRDSADREVLEQLRDRAEVHIARMNTTSEGITDGLVKRLRSAHEQQTSAPQSDTVGEAPGSQPFADNKEWRDGLAPVDVAETRLGIAASETWGLRELPDSVSRIRRGVMNAVAALEDGDYDGAERDLVDARDQATALRASLLSTERDKMDKPLGDLIGALDTFLERHRATRDQRAREDEAARRLDERARADFEDQQTPAAPDETADAPQGDAAGEQTGPKYASRDEVVTPKGTAYVVGYAPDGVLVNENGTYQLYPEDQLSRPGEERAPEPEDPSAEKQQQKLAAAQSPEGLELRADNARLANLNLDEGHGEVLDDAGNVLGWIRRRGTTWYGQDARGGTKSSTSWKENNKGGPIRAAELMASIVAMNARSDRNMVGGEPFRHIAPEDVVAELRYSALPDAQEREFRTLVADWKNSDDPELRTAAENWSRGITMAQMRRLATAVDDAAAAEDTKTKEGRNRQRVLRRLAENIRYQAHLAEGSLSTLPRPGEPDPWAKPYRPQEAPTAAAPSADVADKPEQQGRFLSPAELIEHSVGSNHLVTAEGEKLLFGPDPKTRIAQLADQTTQRSDGDLYVPNTWYKGRYVGNVRATGPKLQEWEAQLPFPGAGMQPPQFRNKKAALAYLALASDAHDNYRDLTRISPDQADQFRSMNLHLDEERNPRVAPAWDRAGRFQDAAAAYDAAGQSRLKALNDLLKSLGRGESPSGNVADDLGTAIDEARWLIEHGPHLTEDSDTILRDELGSVINRAARHLDVLRPEDPRAYNHTRQRNDDANAFMREQSAKVKKADAEKVAPDALNVGDLIELYGFEDGDSGGAPRRRREFGYVVGRPVRGTIAHGGKGPVSGWRVTISDTPFSPPGFHSGRITLFIRDKDKGVPRLARAEDTGLPVNEIIHDRKDREETVADLPHQDASEADDRDAAGVPDGTARDGQDDGDTASDREEESQDERGQDQEEDGNREGRGRRRDRGDRDGAAPDEASGDGADEDRDGSPDRDHDDEDDGASGEDIDERAGRERDRDRRRRRRDRRDRDRDRPDGPDLDRPLLPHIPEHDNRDDGNGDGDDSSDLDGLRDDYRAGRNLPTGMDTPEHRDFLRRLADNPTLTRSAGGGLVMWTDDHEALANGQPALWYFAHALTGAGFGGAGNTAVAAYSAAQARELADRYERLTDASGTPFTWNGDLDPAAVRAWRDGQGRNLPQAMRAERDAFESNDARAEPSALPEDLSVLSDAELESLPHQDFNAEDWERYAAEMDRRFPPADRLRDVLPQEPPASNEEREAENKAMDEALGFGRMDVAPEIVRPKRPSKDQQLRDEYQVWHEERRNRADIAMRGASMLNNEGQRKGYSEDDVFNGGFLSANDAWRKYASDELIEWFDQNGGRVTYNQFREQKRQSERLDRWEWEEQQRAARGETDAPAEPADTADSAVADTGTDAPAVAEPETEPAHEPFDTSKPRFSDVAALREHLRGGELDDPGPGGNYDMRSRLDEVIKSKKLEMSPGGRLAIGQFKHHNRRGLQWRILAPGSMNVLFDPVDITREQAIAYTEALEGIRDRDGDPFLWDAPDAPERAMAFRGPDGENLAVAVAKALMEKFDEDDRLYDRTRSHLLLMEEQRMDEHHPKWLASAQQDGYTIPVHHPRDLMPGDEVSAFHVFAYDTLPGGPSEWSERGVVGNRPGYLTRGSVGQGLDFPFGVMGDYVSDGGSATESGKFDLDGNKVGRLTGLHLVADPVRVRTMRRPRPGESVPKPAPSREEHSSAPEAPKLSDVASASAATAPEERPAPEPIGGRTAEWVSVSDLDLGDVVRIEGTTRAGKPRTLSGYVIQAPQRRAVSRRGRSTEMFMTLISATRDGSSGDRSPVWTPVDASAARATSEPDDELERGDSSLVTGAEGDVLSGNIADRIATDPSGRGLFPGSLVRDDNGREGVVTGANSATVSVRWGDDKQESGLAPSSVTVTDGGAARPTGWTPEGQHVRDGHVVSDRDGNFLGTVEGIDGDTAQVATREGIKPVPVTELRTVGEVRDGEPGTLTNTVDVVPTTAGALNEGDVIVHDGEDGPRTVTVTGRDGDGDRVHLDVADTRTGETSHITTTADAPVTHLIDEDGQAPADEEDDVDLRVLEEPQAVDPVIGDTVDPQLAPEERDAIADHGAAPTDSPEVQQAVTRIGEDLPVTPEQATGLADALRATSSPNTAEGRAARRAADHLDAAAGRTRDDGDGRPTPGTVNDLGVGDTVGLPDEDDENNVSPYTVVGIDDLLGGVRQVTVEDANGVRHTRTLAGDQPLWQLPELPDPAGEDAPRRDPNPAPSVDSIVAGHPNRVARAVVDSAIAGTEPAGSIHQLRQQVAERMTSEALLVPMQQARQDAADALKAAGITGRERAQAFQRLKAERLRARAAAIKAVLRTITDLEPLDGESEQDTANRAADLLRMIPDQIGAPPVHSPGTGETGETVARHVDDALMALARQAFGDGLSDEDALRLGRVLSGRMDATRQATARRIVRHLPPAQRQRLLPQVIALLIRIGRRIVAMVKALLQAARRAWNSEAFRRFRERLVARVKSWPESRRLHRIAQGADLPQPGDEEGLAERIAHWARLLPAPGRFGQTSRRARWYQRTSRRALAAGDLPAVQDGMRWAPDRAADRGPGATAMRHLAALRAAGADMDRDINTRLAAARPELGDDPQTNMRLAVAYAETAERRARDLAAHPVGHSVNPDYVLELAAARAEAADARAEADRMRAAYAAALPNVVADALASVREMGPGGASALIVAPDSDSDAARALTEVQRFIPRDWLTPAERRLVTARDAEAGGYDPASRTVSVADLGDNGLGTAAYALLEHLQQAQPDLLAAQEVYRYARTHTGRVGARRSSVDELFARLFSSAESGRADVIVPRALQSLFNGDWFEDDDLRAFLLGLLATR